jgi:hypothetical protein
MHLRLAPAFALLAAATLPAQNCSGTSIGATPLIDLGGGTYQGFEGGLYPGGGNAPPGAHAALGQQALANIQPRNAAGNPDANGKIVLVSIGMSNTTQEFSQFVTISDADPLRNAAVVVVDGAQGGQDARRIADPNAPFWTNVDARLAGKGVTPQQVQIAWVKEAVAGPTAGFPAHAQELRDLFGTIAQILKARYPNIQIAFYSSRIYAGYAVTSLNPERYAYESAFGVKWMIDSQMSGNPDLNADPGRGPVKAPWLAWGPYLWADGIRPRSDGLVWLCADFAADGTHPGTGARQKVADMLNAFFSNDAFARPWYGGGGGGNRAAVLPYGTGCPGSLGPLDSRTNSTPYLGNTNLRLGVFNARPAMGAVLFWSTARDVLVFEGCEFLVDLSRVIATLHTTVDASGRAFFSFAVPNDASLGGQSLFVQWLGQDPAVATLRLIGGAALSGGLELRLGTQ